MALKGLGLSKEFMDVYKDREFLKAKDLIIQDYITKTVRKQEEIIREAINNEIGTGWDVIDLKNRLFFEQDYFNPGKVEGSRVLKPYRTLVLDGKRILHLFDPEYKHITNEKSYEIKMSIQYVILNKPKGNDQ